jgi:hypothetical protein
MEQPGRPQRRGDHYFLVLAENYRGMLQVMVLDYKDTLASTASLVAQGKSAGLITRRSLDRNQSKLNDLFFWFFFATCRVGNSFPLGM